MNPVRQVASDNIIDTLFKWRMSWIIHCQFEKKRKPSDIHLSFGLLFVCSSLAVQNITSIRRRPKLFLGVGLPLLKRRSKWKTTFEMGNSFQSSYRIIFVFLFQMRARINIVVKHSHWYAHWTGWFFRAFLLFSSISCVCQRKYFFSQ